MSAKPGKRFSTAAQITVLALFIAGTVVVQQVASMSSASPESALKAAAARATAHPGFNRAAGLAKVRFQDALGTTHTLAELPRGMVLLNVWATWCPPCRKELPSLDQLQQTLGSAAFHVVALSVDDGGLAAVQQFYQQTDVRALQLYAGSGEAMWPLQVSALPTTLLIDRYGNEVWRIVGALPWDDPGIIEVLRSEIAQHGETMGSAEDHPG